MRSPLRTLAATTLCLEAFVLVFAALVAKDLSDLTPAQALAGGGGLALLCVLTAGLLRRPVGYRIGWVLQLSMIATGLVVPMMFVVGVLFTALWAGGLVVGAKVERERAYVASVLATRSAPDADTSDADTSDADTSDADTSGTDGSGAPGAGAAGG